MRIKILLMCLLFLFTYTGLSGQQVKDTTIVSEQKQNLQSPEDIKYKTVKRIYINERYLHKKGDYFNPVFVSFSSILVPGIGQMITGEPLRGLGFMTGFAGSIGVSFAGIAMAYHYDEDDPVHGVYRDLGKVGLGFGIFIIGLASAVGVDLAAGMDAFNIAKVKNLALRDQNRMSYLRVIPWVDKFDQNPSIGFLLTINF